MFIWRAANPHIVDFWWEVDRAVKMVVKQRIPAEVSGINIEYPFLLQEYRQEELDELVNHDMNYT